MTEFAEFHLPDDRRIFVRRSAVTVVYDQIATEEGDWVIESPATPKDAVRNGQGYAYVKRPGSPIAVVHTATTGMPVPYTAQQVMDILNG